MQARLVAAISGRHGRRGGGLLLLEAGVWGVHGAVKKAGEPTSAGVHRDVQSRVAAACMRTLVQQLAKVFIDGDDYATCKRSVCCLCHSIDVTSAIQQLS